MNETDKRVVQMEFDNSKFDKNVKKSSATLSKFEEQLKFKDVSDSLNVVKKGFSSFEIAAITAVSRITNAVIDLGVKVTKSLSIDQISDGWQKFGDKTIAVATLAAQKIVIAGKELDVYSDKMEGIYDQLEKLEWFTNETSYNFNDMVAALGKFTAAGQDLDKSVNAMMGIANWAAMSGANAQKASSAMTQLAQTLGRGYVLRIDWQSIQTLNMDTSMFRETVLKTAEEMGKLKKVGNDFISSTGKKITSVNFTETLASKWFTSDILVKTLEKYSAAVQDIYDISEKEGISARAVIEKYRDSLDQFGVAAFEAAQQTRTLGEAITYVLSTIGSTWSQTFEKIFGSFEQAKELWSDLSDALYEDVIASNDFRNSILNVWKDLEGRKDLFEHGGKNQGAFWNIYDSIIAIKKIFSTAKEAIFPKSIFESEADQANELGLRFKEFTKRLQESTAKMLKNIQNDTKFLNILKGVNSVIRIIIVSLAGVWNAISPVVDVLRDLINNLLTRLSILGNKLSNSTGVLETIIDISNKLRETIANLLQEINPEGILNDIFGLFSNIGNLIKNFLKTLNETGGTAKNFERIIKGIASALSILIKIVKEVISLLNKYVTPIVVNVLDIVSDILATILGVITEALATISDFFTAVNDMLNGNESDLSVYGKVVTDFIKSLPTKLKKLEPVLKGLLKIIEQLIEILMTIPKALNNISKSLTGRGIVDNIAYIFDTIAGVLKKFSSVLKKEVPSGDAKKIFNPILTLTQGIIDLIRGLLSILGPVISIVGQLLSAIGAIFEGIGKILNQFVKDGDITNDKIFKVIAILAVSLGLILALTRMFVWIRDGIVGLIFPIYYLKEVVEDSIWNFSVAAKLFSISRIIESIGYSFLTLSLSMLIIGKIDKNEFIKGAATLGTFILIIGTISVLVTVLNKNLGKMTKTFKWTKKGINKADETVITSLDSVAVLIKRISTSMLYLAVTMKLISKIPEKDMWRAFASIGIFIGSIATFVSLIRILDVVSIKAGKGKNVSNSVKYLGDIVNGLGKAILGFAVSLKIISTLNNNDIWRSFAVIAAFLGMLWLMLVSIENNSRGITDKGSGKAIEGLSAVVQKIGGALIKFVLALSILSLIPTDKIWTSVGILSIFMALVIVLVDTALLSAKNIKGAGPAMDALSDVIKQIGKSLLGIIIAISALSLLMTSGKLDEKKLWSAFGVLGSMLVLLTGMIISINLTAKKNQNAPKIMSKLSIIIGMLSVFVLSFAGAMMMLSNIDTSFMIITMLGLITVMASLAVLSNIIDGDNLVSMGVALLLIAPALIIFALALQQMASVDWGSIGKMVASLVLLAGALLVFGLLGETFAAGILIASTAVLILSAGLLMLGLAFALLSTFFIQFCTLVTENAEVIKTSIIALAESIVLAFSTILQGMLMTFIETIPLIAEAISSLIVALCQIIIDSAPKIFEALTVIITGILQMLIDITPKIFEWFTLLVESILQMLIEVMPRFLEFLSTLIGGLLQIFIDNMPKFITLLNQLVSGLLTILINNTPKFIEWLTDLIKGFLQLIRDTIPDLVDTLLVVVDAGLDFLVGLVGTIVDHIFELIIRILDSLITHIPEFVAKTIEAIGTYIKAILSELPNLFEDIVVGVINLMNGLADTINKYKDDFRKAGRNLMDALGQGIGELATAPLQLIKSIGKGMIDGFKSLFGIHSPSKVFKGFGEYMMEGLKEGLDDGSDKAVEGIEDVADNMNNAISKVSDYISESMDDEDLTIKPVLDLSDVDKGVKDIQSLMSGISGGTDVSVTGDIAAKTSRSIERKNSESVAGSGNQNVVNNEGDNYYNTWNITTNDPEEFAKQADTILQKLRLRANLAKGGAR